MNAGYSYSMDHPSGSVVRELEMECPCTDGYATLTVDDQRKVLKIVTFGCGADCENDYSNGQYDAEIQEAIAEAERVADNGPTERQLESLYDFNSGPADTSSSYIQSLRDAGRYR